MVRPSSYQQASFGFHFFPRRNITYQSLPRVRIEGLAILRGIRRGSNADQLVPRIVYKTLNQIGGVIELVLLNGVHLFGALIDNREKD